MHCNIGPRWNEETEISRIEIDIVSSREFDWTVYDDLERAVLLASGDSNDIEQMARLSALLVGAMLGVLPRQIPGQPSLN
jgi:hypothetical protein